MANREAMKMALGALEDYEPNEAHRVVTAMREALEQPEQWIDEMAEVPEHAWPNQPEQQPVAGYVWEE